MTVRSVSDPRKLSNCLVGGDTTDESGTRYKNYSVLLEVVETIPDIALRVLKVIGEESLGSYPLIDLDKWFVKLSSKDYRDIVTFNIEDFKETNAYKSGIAFNSRYSSAKAEYVSVTYDLSKTKMIHHYDPILMIVGWESKFAVRFTGAASKHVLYHDTELYHEGRHRKYTHFISPAPTLPNFGNIPGDFIYDYFSIPIRVAALKFVEAYSQKHLREKRQAIFDFEKDAFDAIKQELGVLRKFQHEWQERSPKLRYFYERDDYIQSLAEKGVGLTHKERVAMATHKYKHPDLQQ